LPNASDVGSVFNSGVIPSNSLFQQTFNRQGEYVYHCMIHPWRSAIVTVSAAFQKGNNFEMSSGTGHILNLTQDSRILLEFKPQTVQLDRATPLVYNVTILENNKDPVFSDTFVTNGASLSLELIAEEGNETISYGPDFSSRGTFHVEGPFLKCNTGYTIKVELAAINSVPPENPINDEFILRTVA
jgi:hypothetical protein